MKQYLSREHRKHLNENEITFKERYPEENNKAATSLPQALGVCKLKSILDPLLQSVEEESGEIVLIFFKHETTVITKNSVLKE